MSIPDYKIVHIGFFNGISDTINILLEHTKENELLVRFRNYIENNLSVKIDTLTEINDYINQLESSFTKILLELELEPGGQADMWAGKVVQQLAEQKKNIHSLAPWLLFTPVPARFESLIPELPSVPTLKQIALIEQLLLQKIIGYYADEIIDAETEWLNGFRTAITEASRRAKEMILTIEQLAAKCMNLSNMEYDFLFDKSQNLLSIGYNVEERRRDNSYYDLLASEARLTTLLG